MGAELSLQNTAIAQLKIDRSPSIKSNDAKSVSSPGSRKPYQLWLRGLGQDPYQKQKERPRIRDNRRSKTPYSEKSYKSNQDESGIIRLQRILPEVEDLDNKVTEQPLNLNPLDDPFTQQQDLIDDDQLTEENPSDSEDAGKGNHQQKSPSHDQSKEEDNPQEDQLTDVPQIKKQDISIDKPLELQIPLNSNPKEEQKINGGTGIRKQSYQKNIKQIVNKKKKFDDFDSDEDLATGDKNEIGNVMTRQTTKNMNSIKQIPQQEVKPREEKKKMQEEPLDDMDIEMIDDRRKGIVMPNIREQKKQISVQVPLYSNSKLEVPDSGLKLRHEDSSKYNTTKQTSNEVTPRTLRSAASFSDQSSIKKNFFSSPILKEKVKQKVQRKIFEDQKHKDEKQKPKQKKSENEKPKKEEIKKQVKINKDKKPEIKKPTSVDKVQPLEQSILKNKTQTNQKKPLQKKKNSSAEKKKVPELALSQIKEKVKPLKSLNTQRTSSKPKKKKKQKDDGILQKSPIDPNKPKKKVKINERSKEGKQLTASGKKTKKKRATSQPNKVPVQEKKLTDIRKSFAHIDIQKLLQPTVKKTEKRKIIRPKVELPKPKVYLDPKTMVRPAILDRTINTAMSQRKPLINSEAKKKKRNKSEKSDKKSVIKSYFDEEEIKDFGADDPIIFQGELYRFKPGIQNNFISRWVQVSKRAFRYFRNQYQALGLSRPIVSFPKKAIEDICQIKVDKNAYLKQRKTNGEELKLFDNMFELYLRDDYEDLYKFRDEEIRQESLNRSIMSAHSYDFKNVNNSFSLYLNQKDKKERRYRSHSFSQDGDNHSNSSFRQDLDDSMLSEYVRRVKYHKKEYRNCQIIKKREKALLIEEPKINRIVQGHLMSVRDQNCGQQKNKYLEDQTILNKEFGIETKHQQKNISGWTNRTLDWYNSERRVIFAFKSDSKVKYQDLQKVIFSSEFDF